MLSTNSSSSIQNRRKQHRRQQSLEVPLITTHIPANPRRNQQAHHGHRRGLSLDQSLSALNSPTGFRPLLPQDHTEQPPAGSPSVRIQLNTNIGQPPNQQHYTQVQETQQQRPAQPGYPAPPQDFHSHLQQQLNGTFNAPVDFKPVIASPQPHVPQQHQALQELQHHLEWYRNMYGHSPNPSMSTTPVFDPNMPMAGMMPGAPMQMPMLQQTQIAPQTPMSQGHARTVPNTPQTYTQSWPSPPPTNAKHARSQSFQVDSAPMGGDSFTKGLVAMPFTQANGLLHDSATFASDAGYASSAYSSSVVDPLSPCPQPISGHMPTLFEEPTPPLQGQATQGQFGDSSILLQATAGAQDFNDADFEFGGVALSPRQQLLNNLGPDVPASIVETGIPAYEVQQYIGELCESDNKYPCMWEGCNRRFGRKENVRAHVQTHLGDRQFKCNLCDKTFVRQHDLKRHIAIHSDDRPFVCPCGTGFARHDALTRHRQRGMCDGALPGFEKSEEEKPKRGRPKKERPDMESRVDKASKQRKKNRTKESAGGDDEPDVHITYASSSSGGSDRSFPVTPPASDAFDTDAFLNMAAGNTQYDSATGAWRDTPPTSPVTSSPTKTVDSFDPTFDFNAPVSKDIGISPAMLSNHSSPPASDHGATVDHTTPQSNHDIFDYASPSASNGASGSFNGGSSPAEINFFDDFIAGVGTQPDVGFDAFSPPGESHGSSSVYNYSDHDAFLEKELNDFVTTAAPSESMFATAMPNVDADSGRTLSDMLDDWITHH